MNVEKMSREELEAELRKLSQRDERNVERDDERKLRQRFEALDRASVCMNQALARQNGLTQEDFLQVVVDQARIAVDAEFAALGVGADPEKPFSTWAYSGMPAERAYAIGQLPHPRGVLGEVVCTGQTLCLCD